MNKQWKSHKNSHGIEKVHDETNEFGFTDFTILIIVDNVDKRLNVSFSESYIFTHFWNDLLDEVVDLLWWQETILIIVDLGKQSVHCLWYCLVHCLLLAWLLVTKLVWEIANIILSLFSGHGLFSFNDMVRSAWSCAAFLTQLRSDIGGFFGDILSISKNHKLIT